MGNASNWQLHSSTPTTAATPQVSCPHLSPGIHVSNEEMVKLQNPMSLFPSKIAKRLHTSLTMKIGWNFGQDWYSFLSIYLLAATLCYFLLFFLSALCCSWMMASCWGGFELMSDHRFIYFSLYHHTIWISNFNPDLSFDLSHLLRLDWGPLFLV